jgi:hypothetical protein
MTGGIGDGTLVGSSCMGDGAGAGGLKKDGGDGSGS